MYAKGYYPYESSFKVTIEKKALNSISGVTAVDRKYTRSLDVQLNISKAELDGVIEKDIDQIKLESAKGKVSDKNVGENKTVTIYDCEFSGSAAENYTDPTTAPTTTVNITKEDLVAYLNCESQTYYGSNVNYFTYIILDEDSDFDATVTAESSDNNVATASVVANKHQVMITPQKTNGEATITVKIANSTNYNDVELTHTAICKTTDIIFTTSPASGLVYNGSSQALGTCGASAEATGATVNIKYRLSESEQWSAQAPSATDAGDYTVYCQGSYSIGTATEVVAETSFLVTIDKADNAINGLACSDVDYGVSPSPSVSSVASGDTPTYTYCATQSGEFAE